MLGRSKSCGNIRFVDKHYKPGKVISRVSVVIVTVSHEIWMV